MHELLLTFFIHCMAYSDSNSITQLNNKKWHRLNTLSGCELYLHIGDIYICNGEAQGSTID